ncbi:MAG: ThiF family adenylyltransferase [Gammaproteobacteria bacterium]|nr:ThiF family adenylyltransferase [Gammaproteobacteria bacterium]
MGIWQESNKTLDYLSEKQIAIIGCGSIGSSLARLLVQSGLTYLVLVNPDTLSPANLSRHALGSKYINFNKANALCYLLREDFPVLYRVIAYNRRFDALGQQELDEIAQCDIVLTAGLDIEGDMQVDNWRRMLKAPPVHICVWVEAFALYGHT